MRRGGVARENFLIAKIRDSESARHAFVWCAGVAMRCVQRHARAVRITKTSAAQAFPAILTIGDVEISGTIRIASNNSRRIAIERAARAPTSARQHFLKRDAVFFNVLVYSGCSAFRFPNARSD
jgi:hypothetical protein